LLGSFCNLSQDLLRVRLCKFVLLVTYAYLLEQSVTVPILSMSKDLLDEQAAGPMKNIRFTIQAKVHCPSHQSHNLKANIGLERSLFRGSLPTLATT
jgi:hypothetical protein